jgi:hypothetical protein
VPALSGEAGCTASAIPTSAPLVADDRTIDISDAHAVVDAPLAGSPE